MSEWARHLPMLLWLLWQPSLYCVSNFNPRRHIYDFPCPPVNWVYVSFHRTSAAAVPTNFLPPQPHPPSPLPLHCTHSFPCDDSPNGSVEYEVDKKPYSRSGRASRDLTPQFMATETLSSTPSKTSGRCVAMTHSGMQCRLRALPGAMTCHRHS